jgi:hypothetical protein
MEAELPATTAAALYEALAELVDGNAPGGDLGLVRVRACTTHAAAELVIRMRHQDCALADAFARANGRLARVAGTAEFERALTGEARVLLRVPA